MKEWPIKQSAQKNKQYKILEQKIQHIFNVHEIRVLSIKR